MCDIGQVVLAGASYDDDADPEVYRLLVRSPYGAFFLRVHRRTLWTVENTGKLIKLGHTANHSAGQGNKKVT